MIIDTHTHLPGRYLGVMSPIADVRAEFERHGVGRAWIMTTDGLIRNTHAHNDELAEVVRAHQDFFIPFCTVDPFAGSDLAIREMQRAKEELGMRGLKLHPWLQSFSLSHPAIVPILRAAGELRFPVLFHDGTPPYSAPLQIAAAAEQAPDTTIILGHSGLDDLYDEAILACRRHHNIYICCCSISSGYLAEVIDQCPKERLLFGSDGGFVPGLVKFGLDKIEAACDDEAIKQAILFENAQKLLG